MANYNIDAIYNGSTSLPGTERIRIDGAGNVGVNQSSPAYKLDVNGTARIANDMLATGNITIGKAAAYLILDGTNSDAEIYWRANSSNRWAAGMNVGDATENFNIYNYTTATTNFTILKANGNVGIGSTAPAYKLDVNGVIASSGSPIAWFSGNYNRIFEPAGNPALYLGNNSDPANYYDNNTHFFRNRGGSSTYAVIEGNGNLGIGTTSVTAPLHIYRASNPWIRLNGGGSFGYIRFDDGTSNGYLFKNTSSDTTNGALAGAMYTYTDSNKAFQHIHSGTPLFTILSGGNVGIGTTSPSTKLHVVGNADIGDSTADTGIIVRHGAGSAQYGRIRFYDSGGNNIHTIHSFPTAWQGGTFLNSSAGALNLTGTNGVTFGAWNSVDVAFASNGNNYFKGNVGIGVTTAATKFVVSADATDSDVGQLRVIGSTSTAKMINVGYHTTNNYGFISSLIAGSGYSALSLQPNGGNVGIATVSPDVRLHVINGTTKLNKNNYKTTTAYSTADLVLGDDVSSRTGYAGNGSNLVLHANGTTSITFLDQTRNLGEITYSNKLFTIGGDIGWGTASVSFPGTVNFGANIYHSIGGQKFFAGSGGNYAYLYTGGVALNFLNSTDTSTLMTVLNDGNVGIGTTSPNSKLHIVGGPSTQLKVEGGEADLWLISQNIGATWRILGSLGNTTKLFRIYDQDNALDRFNINSSGNVGIGTTSPAARLQLGTLAGLSTATPETISLGGTFSNSAGSNIKLKVYDDGTSIGGMSVSSGQIEVNTWSSGKIAFYRGTTQCAIIADNGNVGIGTSSPASKLQTYATNTGAQFLMSGADGVNSLNFGLGFSVNSQTFATIAGYYTNSAGSGSGDITFYTKITSTALSEKMRIQADGNVGIGTTSPITNLHVAGTTSIIPTYDSGSGYSYFLRMGYDTSGSYDYTIKRNGTTGFLEFNGTQGSPYVSYVFAGGDVYSGASGGTIGGFYFNSSSHGIRRATGTNDVYCFTTSGTLYLGAGGSSTTHVRVLSGGDVGIGVSPSYKLDVNGNIHGTGFPTSSDVRFKKNITPLQNSLEKIKKLQGVKYEWNEFVNSRRDGYKLNIPIIGLIAQDVEQVVPEIVDHWKLSEDCQDARSIDYPRLIPLLIEAMKEQQNQIEELRNEIKSLKSN